MPLDTKTAFVTGTSSGLGRGLAEYLSRQGWLVYGCSRRGCDLSGVKDQICDLTDIRKVLDPQACAELYGGVRK